MLTKIDWISFSFPAEFPEGLTFPQFFHRVDKYLADIHGLLPDLLNLHGFELKGQGRAPYNLSYVHPTSKIVIFFSTTLKHALCEISGQGCSWLEEKGQLLNVLALVKKRITRLDVASDILCDTDPIKFAEQRDTGHFRAHSEFVSESGSTAYVGSRTSDRYARVYRYNPPHERAHLLRIEYVFKGETAKLTADTLHRNSAQAVSVAAGEAFGWKHPVYDPDTSEFAELSVWRPERHEGKTLFWLNDTIAPLLVRLQKEGVLDATQWLHDNVLSKLTSSDPE